MLGKHSVACTAAGLLSLLLHRCMHGCIGVAQSFHLVVTCRPIACSANPSYSSAHPALLCRRYTVEFGVVREGGDVKAFGAGVLSSFGELQHMAADRAELVPLDVSAPLPKMSYKCAESSAACLAVVSTMQVQGGKQGGAEPSCCCSPFHLL